MGQSDQGSTVCVHAVAIDLQEDGLYYIYVILSSLAHIKYTDRQKLLQQCEEEDDLQEI
jgi:hypothetical protein